MCGGGGTRRASEIVLFFFRSKQWKRTKQTRRLRTLHWWQTIQTETLPYARIRLRLLRSDTQAHSSHTVREPKSISQRRVLKNPQNGWSNARCTLYGVCLCTGYAYMCVVPYAATLILLLLLLLPHRMWCCCYCFPLTHAILQRKTYEHTHARTHTHNGLKEKRRKKNSSSYLHLDGVIFWYNSLVGFSNSRILLVVFTFVGRKKIFYFYF